MLFSQIIYYIYPMKNKRFSLQIRIFLAMLLIVLIASILIIGVTLIQNRKQAKDYHIKRLKRKEAAINRSINEHLKTTTWFVESKNLKYIFKDAIFTISNIHRLEINFFDFKGKLILSSSKDIVKNPKPKVISDEILKKLQEDVTRHSFVNETKKEKIVYRTSYSYIYDNKNNPVAILSIPYIEESKSHELQLNDFLKRITFVFLLVLLIATFIAYFLSRYITLPIKTIADKMGNTGLNHRNEKINIKGGSEEIHNLVHAYNSMIDKLEESAVKLAKSEREQAWREMAKQVAHEIKNPLTPMRLSVQSFQRRFDPQDIDAKAKINEFSQTIIQQIDTMSSIASAFSDFAKMPVAHKVPLNVVDVVKHAVDIFSESYISFFSDKESIIIPIDKTQLVRVITNLVTNANQALSLDKSPKIEVRIQEDNKQVKIMVADNGRGIATEVKNRIFEPKFTTKTSGMGLGLPMVKNIIETYGGTISFVSEEGRGTVFTVVLPKE